jgi:hypothetical protein
VPLPNFRSAPLSRVIEVSIDSNSVSGILITMRHDLHQQHDRSERETQPSAHRKRSALALMMSTELPSDLRVGKLLDIPTRDRVG